MTYKDHSPGQAAQGTAAALGSIDSAVSSFSTVSALSPAAPTAPVSQVSAASRGVVAGIPVLGADVHPSIKEQLSKSSDYDADVVVIGSGPGGYVAAIRAAQLGARAVVVEKGAVGGVCLNVGCIPTKALLSCVAVLDSVKNGSEFGVRVGEPALDIPAMMKRKNATVKQLTSGIEALFRKNKVRLVRGHGRMVDAHTVAVDTRNGKETITADKIILAAGSVPAKLPVPGLEIGGNVWTSTEALDFDKVPKSLLVVGAGAIGLESGYTFARMGTDVLVVEMMSQILPTADTQCAKELQRSLEAGGMKFMTDSTVTRAEDAKGGKKVTIKSGDKEQTKVFEKVLVAVGRRAVLDDIGLEKAGVKHDGRKVIVNDRMQTNLPNVYAIGDMVGEPMLAHVAWAEAVVAVENAFGMDVKMDYKAFPACVYTTPEFSCVGMTEEQARERYKEVRTGTFSFAFNGKAMGMGETAGFIKFVTEPKYGQILGVHMLGPHTTDLIAEAVLAVRNELTLEEVVNTIHPHPTLSEAVQEAALDALGKAIHK